MFQRFLPAGVHNVFKIRSDARDTVADRARLSLIAEAIETAIETAEAERIGLDRRLEEALARAAVTLGTGTDEYLERDAIDSKLQDLLSAEIKKGERRLAELEDQLGHLTFLRMAMITRFPA